MDYFKAEPMKYWSFPPQMDAESRKNNLEQMIFSHKYIASEKIDGNWARVIITPEKKAIQTRGISKKTGEYGEVQDRILYWDSIENCFSKTTVFLCELYLDNGIDRNVGTILRSLPQKALSIQSEEMFNKYVVQLTKKDRKEIELNEFRNCPVKMYVFDVLCYEGKELQDSPFCDRIKYIEKIVNKINNPNVSAAKYFDVDESFYEKMEEIFGRGGEGAVCSEKNMTYKFGARTAWKTCKFKQEISNAIDCFIIGVERPSREYVGKEIGSWKYWLNVCTGEFLEGELFQRYRLGETIVPITKGYFYSLPSAIRLGVYDENGEIVELCKVSGISDDFREKLRDNYSDWHLCPVSITGMMISEANGISVRHPSLKSIRKNDIDIKDCTLSKIIGG